MTNTAYACTNARTHGRPAGDGTFGPKGTLRTSRYRSLRITVRSGAAAYSRVLTPITGACGKVSLAKAEATVTELKSLLVITAT